MQVSGPYRPLNFTQLLPVVQPLAMLHLANWCKREWLVCSLLALRGERERGRKRAGGGSSWHASQIDQISSLDFTCIHLAFYYVLLIKVRHTATYADYAGAVTLKCAATRCWGSPYISFNSNDIGGNLPQRWNINISSPLPSRSKLTGCFGCRFIFLAMINWVFCVFYVCRIAHCCVDIFLHV